MKLNINTIWHEFGHVFSYKLVEKLGSKPRKVIAYNLTEGKHNPFIETDFKDFMPKQNEDFHDYRNRIKNSFNNNEFYYQCIVLVMGAVFHLENSKYLPTIENFKLIFENIDEITDNSIQGHAGNDFYNLKLYLMDNEGNLMYNDIIIFTFRLHQVLKKYNFFNTSKKLIENFDAKYNGTRNEGIDLLKEEMKDIGNMINDNLLNAINFEIENFKKNNN